MKIESKKIRYSDVVYQVFQTSDGVEYFYCYQGFGEETSKAPRLLSEVSYEIVHETANNT